MGRNIILSLMRMAMLLIGVKEDGHKIYNWPQ